MSAHGVKRKIDAVDFGNSTPSIGRTQAIIPAGTLLSVRGFALDDGILGHVSVPAVPAIDLGGTSFIIEGRLNWIDGSGPLHVALKVLTTPMDDQQQSTLIRRELAVLRTLTPHPNILPFIGTCDHNVYTIIVSPLIRNRNLLNYLQRNPAADRHRFVVQVAQALYHVHDILKLVHGDLKCENVLVSDEGNALLADFGLATGIEKASSETATATDIRALSTWRFNAPELMDDNVFDTDNDGRPRKRSKTSATDIYAFGMLIVQAFTEEHPWAQCKNLVQIIIAVCVSKSMHPRPDARSHAVKMGFTDLHWTSVLFALCHGQPAYVHITRPLYESMRSQHMVRSGIMHPIEPAVEGRVVDMFELHQAHFHAQGIERQLPDYMWQLIAGKIGFQVGPNNFGSTISTAHKIKNIYELHLRDFDITLAQKLLVSTQQQQLQSYVELKVPFNPITTVPMPPYAPMLHYLTQHRQAMANHVYSADTPQKCLQLTNLVNNDIQTQERRYRLMLEQGATGAEVERVQAEVHVKLAWLNQLNEKLRILVQQNGVRPLDHDPSGPSELQERMQAAAMSR